MGERTASAAQCEHQPHRSYGTGRAPEPIWRDVQGAGPRCVVVGGGLGGLSAALRLLEQGHQVVLVEAGPVFGGRATSWIDAGGRYADTGLHVVGGHYRRLRALIETLGARDALQWWTSHPWFGANGERLSFGFSRLPPPLNLWHPLRSIPLTWRELARLSRVATRVAFLSQADIDALDSVTFDEWQAQQGLSGDFILALGAFAADATTFLDPSRVSARAVVSWLRHFFGNRDSGRIATWRRPIGESLIAPLVSRIREMGGVLRTGATAVSVRLDAGGVAALGVGRADLPGPYVGSSGCIDTAGSVEDIDCDVLVSAVPMQCLRPLFGDPALERAGLQAAMALSTTPGLSALLEFDRPIVTDAAPALVSGRSVRDVFVVPPSWSGVGGRHVVQVLLSDARERWTLADEVLIAQAAIDLTSLWPEANGSTLLSARVQRIEAAMFAAVPGAHALRAETRTGIPNLFVAGDWTRQPYNASMEGAVFSGLEAAAAVCELTRRGKRQR